MDYEDYDDWEIISGLSNEEKVMRIKKMPFERMLKTRFDGYLDLSCRPYYCLKNDNIITFEHLLNKTEANIMKIPKAGKVTVNEIKKELQRYGLNFNMNLESMRKETEFQKMKKNIIELQEEIERLKALVGE